MPNDDDAPDTVNDDDLDDALRETLPALPSAKALEQPCPPYCVGEC